MVSVTLASIPSRLVLLGDFQFSNATRSLLGETAVDPLAPGPEAKPFSQKGTTVTTSLVDKRLNWAGTAAASLNDRFNQVTGCTETDSDACAQTFLTAFAQTPLQFVVVEMAARMFMLAGVAVAVVIIAEEFPSEHRGWGVGMAGALSATGYGLGAALFAAIDVLPYGWRALYAVGVVPLLLLPVLRREIHETSRFAEHHARRRAAGECV